MKVTKILVLVAMTVVVSGNVAFGDPVQPGDPIEYAPTTAALGAEASAVHGEGNTKTLKLYHCPVQGGGYPMYTCECLSDTVRYVMPLIRDGVASCNSTMPAPGFGALNRLTNCSLRVLYSQTDLCMVNDSWYAWDARLFYDCPGHNATNIQTVNVSVEDDPHAGCCSSTRSYSCAY